MINTFSFDIIIVYTLIFAQPIFVSFFKAFFIPLACALSCVLESQQIELHVRHWLALLANGPHPIYTEWAQSVTTYYVLQYSARQFHGGKKTQPCCMIDLQ